MECSHVSSMARGRKALKVKVVIALNTAWNLVNFRSGLIRSLINNGYEVVAVAPSDEYVPRLLDLGVRYVEIPMDNKGTNPIKDLLLFFRYFRLLKTEKPEFFLGFTVKPNIYGSIAAHLLGIHVVNNIAGLGAVFVKGGWLNLLVRGLYRIALARSYKVFFQNEDDRRMFVSSGLVASEVTDLLPGSGVDLIKFSPISLPNASPLRFLLVARMLWDKGIGEFVEAARVLRANGLNAEFCLLGFLDVQNPSAISRAQMNDWEENGVIRYLGSSDNVNEEIAAADCVVLPSFYREGTPRALLEAAAMARPVVTTDSIGCREVVDDGVSGYLCRPKDVLDLAEKLTKVASLSSYEREIMGLRGREKMERVFDERVVINKYLQVLRKG